MRKYLVVSLVIVLALLARPAAWAKDAFVMGVHPYKSAAELHKIFKPIADDISQKLGKPVELRFFKTYTETADALGRGELDFSYLGPVLYVEAKSKYDVIPLVQVVSDGKPTFHGVFVKQKGNPMASLKDLKGKKFAFGDRGSCQSHIMPMYMLIEAGVYSDLKEYSFTGSHTNAALGVKNGTFDAACLQPDVAAAYKEQGLEEFARTIEVPDHVFAATKSMDPAIVASIQNIFLKMDPKLLKGIKGTINKVQKFNDKDFDVLRKILKVVESANTK